MLILNEETIGEGWKEVKFNDNPNSPDYKTPVYIQTLDQYFSVVNGWTTGSYFTGEKFPYMGKVPYRRPISRKAYLTAIFPGWFVKVWRGKIVRLWDKNS